MANMLGRMGEMGGIWIRSQDKGLYYCKGFDAPQAKTYATDKNKAYAIVGYVSGEMQPILGWYETETRALQVLDEIQHAICYIERTKLYDGNISCSTENDLNQFVYQMPES
jgi:hypothetical protein